jgi:hypothetical protein
MNRTLIALALISIAAPVVAQEENIIEMSAVPKAAMDAAMAVPQAKGVTFETAAMDDDEGTMTYELAGKMANGMMLEIDVLADGTIEEIEEQIDISALPAPVKATLDAELAGFAATFVEKSTRPDGAVIYEFEGKHDGKEIDAEINVDGSNFTMADDAAV